MVPATSWDIFISSLLIETLSDETQGEKICACNRGFDLLGIVKVHPAWSDCSFARPNHSESKWPCICCGERHSQPGLAFWLRRLITGLLGLMGVGIGLYGALYMCNSERLGPQQFGERRVFGRLSLARCRELYFNCVRWHTRTHTHRPICNQRLQTLNISVCPQRTTCIKHIFIKWNSIIHWHASAQTPDILQHFQNYRRQY